jgi:hypothetical protein
MIYWTILKRKKVSHHLEDPRLQINPYGTLLATITKTISICSLMSRIVQRREVSSTRAMSHTRGPTMKFYSEKSLCSVYNQLLRTILETSESPTISPRGIIPVGTKIIRLLTLAAVESSRIKDLGLEITNKIKVCSPSLIKLRIVGKDLLTQVSM